MLKAKKFPVESGTQHNIQFTLKIYSSLKKNINDIFQHRKYMICYSRREMFISWPAIQIDPRGKGRNAATPDNGK